MDSTGGKMQDASKAQNSRQTEIMMGLLVAVQRDGEQSQRRLASELGIALGLVNAYLKRCVRKGLVKASKAPARRYAYYLTPRGFAEKSRLTIEFMSRSFVFFRQAKSDLLELMRSAKKQGFSQIALLGISDLSEIALICAMDGGVTIIGVIDARSDRKQFMGVQVVSSFDALRVRYDAVLVTDITNPQSAVRNARAHVGADRTLVPQLLGGLPPQKGNDAG
jgi:DNA-binding MarR family transcriptional regulator